MADLLLLKNIIIDTFVRLQTDDRVEIKNALAGLFIKPLVSFDEAYEIFVSHIGQSASASDRWRAIQIDIITNADDWEGLLTRFDHIYGRVMKESPGGESFVMSHEDSNRMSYHIALMMRVYGDTMYLENSDSGGA